MKAKNLIKEQEIMGIEDFERDVNEFLNSPPIPLAEYLSKHTEYLSKHIPGHDVGVYGFFNDGECLYVGSSVHLFSRIQSHIDYGFSKLAPKLEKRNTLVKVKVLPKGEEAYMRAVEHYSMWLLKPKLNINKSWG